MPSGAQARATTGKEPRLTRQLIEDLVATLRTGTPINWACEFVWINRATYYAWQREASLALAKRPQNRSQRDKLLVEFDTRTRQAVADFAARATMQLGSAAGLTRDRPKRRRTVQVVVPGEQGEPTLDADGKISGGRVLRIEEMTEELAADWRAQDRMLARRFHEEYTGNQGIGDGEAAAGEPIDAGALVEALDRAREKAGLNLNVIEARSFDTGDGPAELAAAHEDDPG